MSNVDKYPDFYCVGAGKSGTTSLYEIFKQHPQVFLPSVKEPYYFVEDSIHQNRFDKQSYLQLYEDALPNQITGDFSPGYFISSEAASRIFKRNPAARIIIILREPVSRAFSDYLMYKQRGRTTLGFMDAIQQEINRIDRSETEDPFFVYTGCYGTHVQRFMDVFSRENILILFMEDLIKQPKILYANVCDFLEIEQVAMKESSLNKKSNQYVEARSFLLNNLLYAKPLKYLLGRVLPDSMKQSGRHVRQKLVYRAAKKPEMPCEIWTLLLPIFREEIGKLQELIGDDALRLSAGWPDNVCDTES